MVGLQIAQEKVAAALEDVPGTDAREALFGTHECLALLGLAAHDHEGGEDLADGFEVVAIRDYKIRRVGQDVNEKLLLAVCFLFIVLEWKGLQPFAIDFIAEQMRKPLPTALDQLSQRSHEVVLAEIDISLVIFFVKGRFIALPDRLHPSYHIFLNYQLLRSLIEDYSHAIRAHTAQFTAAVFHESIEKHHQVAPIGGELKIGAGLYEAKGEIEAKHLPIEFFAYCEGYLRNQHVYQHIFFALSAYFEQTAVDRRNEVGDFKQLCLSLLILVVLIRNIDFFLTAACFVGFVDLLVGLDNIHFLLFASQLLLFVSQALLQSLLKGKQFIGYSHD